MTLLLKIVFQCPGGVSDAAVGPELGQAPVVVGREAQHRRIRLAGDRVDAVALAVVEPSGLLWCVAGPISITVESAGSSIALFSISATAFAQILVSGPLSSGGMPDHGGVPCPDPGRDRSERRRHPPQCGPMNSWIEAPITMPF